MKLTQHQKIINLCGDGEYHCQIEFWNLFIRSPHKRRGEIEEKGQYHFETRDCIHGVKNGFDYRMSGEKRSQKVEYVERNGVMVAVIKQLTLSI